jgi:hypothetical protein
MPVFAGEDDLLLRLVEVFGLPAVRLRAVPFDWLVLRVRLELVFDLFFVDLLVIT